MSGSDIVVGGQRPMEKAEGKGMGPMGAKLVRIRHLLMEKAKGKQQRQGANGCKVGQDQTSSNGAMEKAKGKCEVPMGAKLVRI